MGAPAYEHRHFGTVLVWILLPAVVACAAWAWSAADEPRAARIVLWTVTAVLLVVLVLFWSLKVRVDEAGVRVAFALGWPARMLPLSEIEGTAVVKRSWLWGYGLRWTPKGWLWRVSGLRAVEVKRAERKSFFIGTDEPEALAQAIEAHRAASA